MKIAFAKYQEPIFLSSLVKIDCLITLDSAGSFQNQLHKKLVLKDNAPALSALQLLNSFEQTN
jgi:hypothetical protein